MWLFRPPGVYRPQGETWFLADTFRTATAVRLGDSVLDIGTGTGALAVIAARVGAARVVAVDISRRAVIAAWVNARMRRLPVRARRSDLFAALGEESFDVIVANPPSVCAEDAAGRSAWCGGPSGRAVLDPLCAAVPDRLAPGGTLLIVHSTLCGVPETLESLRSAGLKAAVIARRREPFGPLMQAAAEDLETRGLIGRGQRYEELVVIRADRPE
ncbi:HemK2/MTQ2 family protein methyltransferase [Actinomadura sp. DC4]|uniref:HemK2/MTQ2 family protein methyltransferase n=1 Tax=Actinomadura sp. DC4 TaxID=3055069 RepID=UPI0025B09433|nr:HemK2/MTQ2 family protein methyltransferase [Actinomadura sp. DC4]MDN3353830.1 methyltransferase [Actinomadura sp. DC4]